MTYEELYKKYHLSEHTRRWELLIIRQYFVYVMHRKHIRIKRITAITNQYPSNIPPTLKRINNFIDCKDKVMMEVIAKYSDEFKNAK